MDVVRGMPCAATSKAAYQSVILVHGLSIVMCSSCGTHATCPLCRLLNNTFDKTPVIVDNCFDDHQWWLLGWLRRSVSNMCYIHCFVSTLPHQSHHRRCSFVATGDDRFLARAVAVFDFVVANGWTGLCGGGVLWCPTGNPYKNAITVELFLASAMVRTRGSSCWLLVS